ncbi:MAG TPA: ATP-dependent DNA helicase UvrD2 [Acidimicrobiales bacterium]|nr:ATP-dependent DNA helicase UvrD2 [Acidimicrobiales bacterium]
MAVFPGPAALGRGLLVPAGRPLPRECEAWPRVVVDDAALAEPAPVADVLHQHWLRRLPCVVVLAVDPACLRAPERCEREVWEVEEGFEFARERLQFLMWSNNYDLRGDEPVWWHGRRAERLGATATASSADVVLPDGRAVFCDGGPRQPLDLAGGAVVHRETLEAGLLEPDTNRRATADLGRDQLAAVEHGAGPARVIAPAGSGKTRVLTERLRHLLADRGVTPSTVTAVAYNKRAADELAARTEGLPVHLRTLNSLGLAVVNGSGPFAPTGERRGVIEEVEVRRLLESLVDVRRQQNTDPFAVYLDALSAIRLGLADPRAVEESFPDAAGVAELFPRYRAALAERSVVDFDEQIYLAIELLLRQAEVRRHNQQLTRHLLVDEFQDLTPAHLLLLRLLSAPTYDVFGVGDDDQVIYSYAGATPEYLIGYRTHFPGAAEYALETNYRCPPAIVEGARRLLGHNRRRVAKSIKAAAHRPGGESDLTVDRQPSDRHAAAAAGHIARLVGGGAACHEVAVLARVNSTLLPVQVTLMEHGVPCSAPLGPSILSRTGIRAALAYLRIGTDPEHISRSDIAETVRRPSRRIARNVIDMLHRRPATSVADIRRLAGALSGGDVEKLRWFADDLETVARSVARGNAAATLKAIRVEIGLGSAMEALDGSKGDLERSSHLDDLVALEAVARLHPDPLTFEAWLTGVLEQPGSGGGVVLSTVHRVKGREWPHVIVYGADEGLFPHRLAGDQEEERRVFHVAVTRASRSVVVVADASTPSRFCDELFKRAPVSALATQPVGPPGRQRRPEPASTAGWRGRGGAASSGGAGRSPLSPEAGTVISALRTWRSETARRDKVPAYVVLSDAYLEGIALALPSSLRELARCKGIGPAKLEKYGDDLLAVLEAVAPR